MLPLPRFRVVRPRSLAEALDTLATGTGAADARTVRLLAGGTDLVPNLKHGLYDVETVIAASFGLAQELLDVQRELAEGILGLLPTMPPAKTPAPASSSA